LLGDGANTKGITAGLAIRAAAISTSIPILVGHVSHGVSLSLFRRSSKAQLLRTRKGQAAFLSAKAQELRSHIFFCWLAYRMYAALHKLRYSL